MHEDLMEGEGEDDDVDENVVKPVEASDTSQIVLQS